ncbi:unnamed protein product [Caenorhabditis auriculariae]|uniref:Profilin n=1 Tax=Caenorhabditis auriculariae TaxID=2777116 RepID=A0A8S1GMM5_9PELO|nr:unnamed protein product [Caenorhabditis auriculariae]
MPRSAPEAAESLIIAREDKDIVATAARSSKMSGWDAYIASITGASPAIKRAAIVGTDGSVWARTQDANVFRATEPELKAFVSLFDNLNEVPSKGVDMENTHYVVPRTEENLIFGKKDKCGFFAVKTKSAILIAVYEGPNEVTAQVRRAVEDQLDTRFLRSPTADFTSDCPSRRRRDAGAELFNDLLGTPSLEVGSKT